MLLIIIIVLQLCKSNSKHMKRCKLWSLKIFNWHLKKISFLTFEERISSNTNNLLIILLCLLHHKHFYFSYRFDWDFIYVIMRGSQWGRSWWGASSSHVHVVPVKTLIVAWKTVCQFLAGNLPVKVCQILASPTPKNHRERCHHLWFCSGLSISSRSLFAASFVRRLFISDTE